VFIANSLSPAKVMNVILDNGPDGGKTATVIVPDRQLSLAIGKEGQNARLAAKLTGWRIDIKSATEAAEETLGRLEDVKVAPEDMDLLMLAESILRTQDELGLTPEQREMVQKAVAAREELEPSEKPELEGVAEARTEPGDEPLVEPGREEEEEDVVEPVALVADLEEVAAVPQSELSAAKAEEEIPFAESHRPLVDVPLEEVDEDQLPTVEGEKVDGSIGWLQVESQEDYYSGWSVEESEVEETEWVRDELEEEEDQEEYRKPVGKKKGKKRPKQPSFEDLEMDSRRGRKPGRPHGR
jgi:hypothetical protein